MTQHYICAFGGTAISTGEGFERKDVIIEGIKNGNIIKVIAPDDTAKKWPTVKADWFVECDGPARAISHVEYSQIIG